MKKIIVALILLPTLFCFGQLQLNQIMKGPGFVGNQPSNFKWSVDGKMVFFDWNPQNDIGDKTYYWQPGLTEAQLATAEQINWSKIPYKNQQQFNTIYYANQGVLFAYNKTTKQNNIVYQTNQPIAEVQRSSNADVVYFQQNKNVYQINVKNFQVLQLTNFKTGKATPPEKIENEFLKDQQEQLFKYVNEEKRKTKFRQEQNTQTKIPFPEDIFLNNSTLENIVVAPNGNFVVFRVSDYPEAKDTKVENFITADGYTKNKSAREKVSVNNISKHKLGIYDCKLKTTYYVDFSGLTGIKTIPKYFEEYKTTTKTDDVVVQPKPISMEAPIFNQNGSLAVLEARSFDNKDRWIIQLEVASGKITEIDHQHDEAWIGGPGIAGYNFDTGTLGFLADNQTIYFQSEATGYSHLYTCNLQTKVKKQLTQGNWEVRDVEFSSKSNIFYLTTTETHPGNRSFYKLDINSGVKTPIFTQNGAHEVAVSPDESQLLVRYSFSNKPWDLYVSDNKPNAVLKQITFSQTEDFKKYNFRIPEVITFKATDGTPVNARLYQPKTETKNQAAVIFVHGAGYLQNAHNYWSSYQREYMFHNLLTDLGYTVLDIDYRASDGYGRNHRTGIYRFMGGLDLQDQLDGKKYLTEKLGINNNKVGIYGGSYGGFITLMALLTKPGEFKAGAALRSVTDWAHYNQGYTANILNFPETDPTAYYNSSPINFADNLKDQLLMLHGMVDDNVQFQDIVRLTELFIEKEKKNWDLAVYPVEAHGFVKTYSWTDEYQRILDLFNQQLLSK